MSFMFMILATACDLCGTASLVGTYSGLFADSSQQGSSGGDGKHLPAALTAVYAVSAASSLFWLVLLLTAGRVLPCTAKLRRMRRRAGATASKGALETSTPELHVLADESVQHNPPAVAAGGATPTPASSPLASPSSLSTSVSNLLPSTENGWMLRLPQQVPVSASDPDGDDTEAGQRRARGPVMI